MRLFVAVFITEKEIKERIISLQKEINDLSGKLKQVEPDNLHYTLLFLNEVPKPKVDAVIAELRDVEQVSPFDLELRGVRVFPNPKHPRIFWISAGNGSEGLTNLARQVRSRLGKLGYKDSKSFIPHLTISRIKWLEPEAKTALGKIIQSYENTSFGIQHVDHFSLVKSTLTPQGPIYEAVEEFPLSQKT